jgi:hypothetical protein
MSHSTIQANTIVVDPLDELIIKMFFGLRFACVLSGTLLCLLNFGANTTVKIFGKEWSTTSAGIAFVAIGVFTAYLAARIVLKNRRETKRQKQSRRTAVRAARSKARRSTAPSRGTQGRRTLPKRGRVHLTKPCCGAPGHNKRFTALSIRSDLRRMAPKVSLTILYETTSLSPYQPAPQISNGAAI